MGFKFTLVTTIIDFILMEYNGMGSRDGVTYVGVNSVGNLISISKNFPLNKSIEIPIDNKIINIISCGVKNQKIYNRIVTFKNKNHDFYLNEIYDDNGRISVLGNSEATPILVSDPDMLTPLLGLYKDGKLVFYSINEKHMLDQVFYILVNLVKNHTSAFIDLTGDLRPNLVLIELIDGQKYLKIYDFYKSLNVVPRKDKVRLPLEIGPTLFVDLSGNNSYDLLYVSIENNHSYLNVHLNQIYQDFTQLRNRKNIIEFLDKKQDNNVFLSDPTYKINLNDYFDGIPVINDENGVPTGLYIADLNMSGTNHIFITMKHDNVNQLHCFKFENGKLSISSFDSEFSDYKNIISISFSDIGDNGSQGILINHISDGKPVLVHLKGNPSQENTNLTAITNVKIDENSSWHLPGATYLILYDSGKKCKKASQFVYSSYPSLQHKGIYVGLGNLNLFLECVIVRTNSSIKSYDIFKSPLNIIVPNSSIILSVIKPNWTIQSFYNQKRYNRVVFCLFCLFIINVFVLVILTIREKAALKKQETDENIMIPIFNAL